MAVALADRISQAEGDEKTRLTDLRAKLLAMTEQIDKALQKDREEHKKIFDLIMQKDDFRAALPTAASAIDKTFMQICADELAEARRPPDRERDGTAVWSLSTLRRALRRQGLPQVSTYTIWRVLVDAGLSWQKHRSWCDTGTAQRPRKKGGQTVVVTVTDPDPEAKKN